MTGNSTTKICTTCKVEKSFDEFHNRKSSSDGKEFSCKQCKSIYNKNKYLSNIDFYREKSRISSNRFRKENSKSYEIITKNYRKNNKEKICEQRSVSYISRKRKIRKDQQLYYKRNKISFLEKNSRKRSLKKNVAVGIVNFNYVLQRDNGICHICDLPVLPEELHFDHIIPLSKGGSHSNDNLAVSHALCNLRKGAKLIPELIEKSLLLGKEK